MALILGQRTIKVSSGDRLALEHDAKEGSIGNCAVLKHHETVEIAPAKVLFKFLDSSPPNHKKCISEKI